MLALGLSGFGLALLKPSRLLLDAYLEVILHFSHKKKKIVVKLIILVHDTFMGC